MGASVQTSVGTCDILRRNDMSRIDDADLVLVLDLPKHFPPASQRRKGAIWAYFQLEPPVNHISAAPFNEPGRFNAYISYEDNATIPAPYGFYWPEINASKVEGFPALFQRQAPRVVIVQSNCGSPFRNKRIAQLSQFIEIDIMGRGKCSTVKLPEECRQPLGCHEYLGLRYMFYLAFENAECDDYITEKVWLDSFRANMIPVVWGIRSRYHVHLPPHSYINCADFADARACAQHIKEVASDPALYLKYHAWRGMYSFLSNREFDRFYVPCEFLIKNQRRNLPSIDVARARDRHELCTKLSQHTP